MRSRIDQPRLRLAAGAIFIIAATFLAYGPAIGGGFIWDDDTHVTENPLLRDPPGPASAWHGLRLIWTTLGATPQYYPLTHSSFWIEYRIWGEEPMGYHLTNVTLHVISSLLLWRILNLLGLRAAWLAAAIFALHPIEVESVAWVTERKNVLSGAFYMGAMLAYLRASGIGSGSALRPAPAWGWYIVALGLFACAVLSKTVSGTLPAAILLILWWKSGRIPWRHIVYLLPLFAIALGMGSLTGWMERTYVGAVGPEWAHSPLERVLIAGRAVWFYAYKLVLPVNLSFIYPRWEIDARNPAPYLYPLGAIIVVILLFALRRHLGRGPLACVLYFGGTLLPALGFVNVYPHRFSYVADHFQYLAGIGLIVLLSEAVVRASGSRAAWTIGIPLVLGVLTWRSAHMYRDPRTLWETTLARNPQAWIAHDHLGAIIGAGDPATAAGHYAEAIRLEPGHIEGYIGLGNLLLQTGNLEGAMAQYRRAIAVRPDKPTPYYALGGAQAAAGDLPAAVESYERALAADRRFVPARLRLIDLYTRLGRGEDAARHRAEAQRQVRGLLGR